MTHNIQKSLVLVCFAIGIVTSYTVPVQAQSKDVGQPNQLKGISSLFNNTRGKEASHKSARPEIKQSSKPANVPAKPLSVLELIRANGLPVLKELDHGVVTTEVKLGQTEVRFYVHDSDDQKAIHLRVPLSVLAEGSETQTNKLFDLLSLGFHGDSIRFTYSHRNHSIMLKGTVSRTNISQKTIVSKIKQMRDVLRRTEPNWNTKLWTVPRHVGTWSSLQTSTTLELKSDGLFEWSQKSPVASVVTKGTFKITSDKLTLKDSTGKVVESKIYFINGNQVEIEINGKTIVLDRA